MYYDEDSKERRESEFDRPKRRMGGLLCCVGLGFCDTQSGNDRPNHGLEVSVHEGHRHVDRCLPQRVVYEQLGQTGINTYGKID
jgi:hypothetical protein